VLRLASLLWLLRRASAIESGMFKLQAKHLLWLRQQRRGSEERQKTIDSMCRNAVANGDGLERDDLADNVEGGSDLSSAPNEPYDDVTQSFVRLSNLPTCSLGRLRRYEVTLWCQARQIVSTLQRLDRRRKPWEKLRLR
jgi:hypothetical protein